MRFRPVGRAEREPYRRAVAAAGEKASELGAHFWAFEADGSPAGCMEFLEGPGDEVLESLDRVTEDSLRQAAGGRGPGPTLIDEDGLRSTEIR